MAAQNGMGGANAGMYSNNNNNNVVLSSPGYHSDMQILMDNMERLSGTLQRNRQEWYQVQQGLEKVERLQDRMARDGHLPLVNGDTASHEQLATDQPTVLQLENELAEANRQIIELKDSFMQLRTMQDEYAKGLDAATEMAREFEDKEQKYLQSVHQYYSDQLLQARKETIDAQRTHQAWQARLQKLDESVRAAYKAREEEGHPYRKKIAALKEENRILRTQVGWNPPADSDEEDWEYEEAMRDNRDRGRDSQASQGGEGERLVYHGTTPGVAGVTG